MSNNTNAVAGSAAKSNVRNMVVIAMLGALSGILMVFDFPLWFAPGFYKIDLSEVPVMIGTFALGPVAGALVELVKVLLKLVTKGTDTAFVGDIANFLIGCSMVVPAGMIYKHRKSRKNAVVGIAVGTLFMAFVGCFMNAYVLLPAYGKAFGMPIEALVGMGTAVNPAITSLWSFALLAVVPFNLLKGLVVGIITMLLYKHVSPLLKGHQI
ncbi:MAG: ECF transporter S component [Eubacteriales bacterium]|nr:ECF transporter S component [Eubacteriales bacterium]